MVGIPAGVGSVTTRSLKPKLKYKGLLVEHGPEEVFHLPGQIQPVLEITLCRRLDLHPDQGQNGHWDFWSA